MELKNSTFFLILTIFQDTGRPVQSPKLKTELRTKPIIGSPVL